MVTTFFHFSTFVEVTWGIFLPTIATFRRAVCRPFMEIPFPILVFGKVPLLVAMKLSFRFYLPWCLLVGRLELRSFLIFQTREDLLAFFYEMHLVVFYDCLDFRQRIIFQDEISILLGTYFSQSSLQTILDRWKQCAQEMHHCQLTVRKLGFGQKIYVSVHIHVQVLAVGLLDSHQLLTILQVGEGLTKLAYESGLGTFPIAVLKISDSQLMLEPIDAPIILAIFNGQLEIS